MKLIFKTVLPLAIVLLSSFMLLQQDDRPTLFLIGDSTVRNGSGKGEGQQWGWGNFIQQHLDTTRIRVENRALGGTSSRTFRTRGLWDNVLSRLKPGDFVMMQFGHNDGGPLDDTARARGTIKGVGDESREIYNPITKQKEVVHTYGWYISRFISEAKERGAIPIVCSPVPRNNFRDSKVNRGSSGYSTWAAEAAASAGAWYIDLNTIISDHYDALGPDKVKEFFPADHTHTNKEGALLNARAVIEGVIGNPEIPLNSYLIKK